MYDGANGWAIPSSDDDDPEVRDASEAAALIEILGSIRMLYHDDRPAFNERIRHAWRTLGPRVTAARMLHDYMTDIYGPALEQTRP